MIEFKTIKFKHYRQAQELNQRIDSGEAAEEDVLRFALSLVKLWDFVDEDTGEALPVGELDELSLEQCAEVNRIFARKMGVDAEVKKTNEEASSST